MGLVSWFSSTGRKSAAAASIQGYYEICKRHGIFDGDPVRMANRIVEVGCGRLPGLEEARYKQFVLASACLSVMLMEDEPYESHVRYAMALSAMLQATLTEPKPYSYAEQKILNGAAIVLAGFNERPSPFKMNLDIQATGNP